MGDCSLSLLPSASGRVAGRGALGRSARRVRAARLTPLSAQLGLGLGLGLGLWGRGVCLATSAERCGGGGSNAERWKRICGRGNDTSTSTLSLDANTVSFHAALNLAARLPCSTAASHDDTTRANEHAFPSSFVRALRGVGMSASREYAALMRVVGLETGNNNKASRGDSVWRVSHHARMCNPKNTSRAHVIDPCQRLLWGGHVRP